MSDEGGRINVELRKSNIMEGKKFNFSEKRKAGLREKLCKVKTTINGFFNAPAKLRVI
jgi:hypothetical protein